MKEMNRPHFVGMALIVIFALVIQLSVGATPAHAATSGGNAAYVTLVNRAGGLNGISASKRKNIKSVIYRFEFARMLKNLYGNRINPDAAWIDGAALTQAWACHMMSASAAQMGVKMTWKGGSSGAKVNLGTACKLITLMVGSAASLKPARWPAA
ncbi:hypothetical protein IKE72_01620 [Candidatus Saccharibacteria bacterium]|nr:hypothetical protein [Candidatus Saccharibacteria bacterium]